MTSPSQGARSSCCRRIDGRALAQHGAREYLVGNFRERRAPAGERRANGQCHASVPDELDAADDPDGIDLAAREAEAQIVRAGLRLRVVSRGNAVSPLFDSRRRQRRRLQWVDPRRCRAALRAHHRQWRASAAGCPVASLPIWKLNGIWPTVARNAVILVRSAPRQIQHGFEMFTRNTARSPVDAARRLRATAGSHRRIARGRG